MTKKAIKAKTTKAKIKPHNSGARRAASLKTRPGGPTAQAEPKKAVPGARGHKFASRA
jgi:hypothetical protein